MAHLKRRTNVYESYLHNAQRFTLIQQITEMGLVEQAIQPTIRTHISSLLEREICRSHTAIYITF